MRNRGKWVTEGEELTTVEKKKQTEGRWTRISSPESYSPKTSLVCEEKKKKTKGTGDLTKQEKVRKKRKKRTVGNLWKEQKGGRKKRPKSPRG